jgi:alkylation response protein AidB-like acyl-CoA dehydrogenase
MGLLGYERGVSTIGQQVGFERELDVVVERAKANGSYDDPLVRDRIVQARIGLDVMRLHALRTLSAAEPGPGDASVSKLVWANWHRSLGELAMTVLGQDGLVVESGDPYRVDRLQALFLFSRADTIYGGSNEVQRNIIAERVLGLPREPKG